MIAMSFLCAFLCVPSVKKNFKDSLFFISSSYTILCSNNHKKRTCAFLITIIK